MHIYMHIAELLTVLLIQYIVYSIDIFAIEDFSSIIRHVNRMASWGGKERCFGFCAQQQWPRKHLYLAQHYIEHLCSNIRYKSDFTKFTLLLTTTLLLLHLYG